MMETLLFSVTGIMYRPKKIIKMVADEVNAGDSLELEREPSNEYDPHAVKVFYDDEWIGYVDSNLSQNVSQLIDSGNVYNCKVISCFADWDFDITDSGREIEIVTDIDLLVEITIE